MSKIKIVEVGARDGLQNEKKTLDTQTRIEFIQKLIGCGITTVEVGAFVSAEKIPQMINSDLVLNSFVGNKSYGKINFPVLVPNEKGMIDAINSGAKEVSIFTACSEKFNLANINCTIEESFVRFKPIMDLAKKNKIKVRGYVSTCFYCPYEGKIKPKKVLEVAKKLIKIGCYEVSIGDTVGAANPAEVKKAITLLKKSIPKNRIAMHFHDTRGLALANILQSLQLGITTFDSSLGGLGGCPYAPGAQGNVSTEDVVYMLHGMGYKTGIDLQKLILVNQWVSKTMEKPLPSRVGKSGLPNQKVSVTFW